MTDDEQYESVQILRLQPGDTVVVRVAANIDRPHAEAIRRQLLPKFPGHEVLVLGAGATLEVVRP